MPFLLMIFIGNIVKKQLVEKIMTETMRKFLKTYLHYHGIPKQRPTDCVKIENPTFGRFKTSYQLPDKLIEDIRRRW